jgi:hypothetical protein
MQFRFCVCPAWASFPINIGINLTGASPLWAEVTLRRNAQGSPLGSISKLKGMHSAYLSVANRKVCTEGSRTTKFGSDPSTRAQDKLNTIKRSESRIPKNRLKEMRKPYMRHIS